MAEPVYLPQMRIMKRDNELSLVLLSHRHCVSFTFLTYWARIQSPPTSTLYLSLPLLFHTHSLYLCFFLFVFYSCIILSHIFFHFSSPLHVPARYSCCFLNLSNQMSNNSQTFAPKSLSRVSGHPPPPSPTPPTTQSRSLGWYSRYKSSVKSVNGH